MDASKILLQNTISSITPFDVLETSHQANALAWIDSGAPLFRTVKPATPPKHLVAYFVMYDEDSGRLHLIDHVSSGLLLPTGGHVEPDENPRSTVIRESLEELGIAADFGTKFGRDPFFITINKTVGEGQHIDVSLWYIVRGHPDESYEYEKREVQGARWLTPLQILAMDINTMDRHLHRFANKLIAYTE